MNRKRIAIQGTKASFHEEAAFKFFGDDIQTIQCDSFKATSDALKQKKAAHIMMALEDFKGGSLLSTFHILQGCRVPIIGEVYLSIQLHLMAHPAVTLEQIKTVESHPIALRQCGDFFEEHPNIKVTEGMDTAACAKKIAENKLLDTAAVANSLAAKVYGLEILRSEEHTSELQSRENLV